VLDIDRAGCNNDRFQTAEGVAKCLQPLHSSMITCPLWFGSETVGNAGSVRLYLARLLQKLQKSW